LESPNVYDDDDDDKQDIIIHDNEKGTCMLIDVISGY
jgi:hypothetical protein